MVPTALARVSTGSARMVCKAISDEEAWTCGFQSMKGNLCRETYEQALLEQA